MNAINQSPADTAATAEASAERRVTEEYFQSFNQNQFKQTAALFGEAGELVPPFESPVVGPEAILAYLEKEAGNITAFPERWEIIDEADKAAQKKDSDNLQQLICDRTQIIVTGKVNAIVFKVNVAWYFTLIASDESAPSQIMRVRIKLLASPTELLGLKPA